MAFARGNRHDGRDAQAPSPRLVSQAKAPGSQGLVRCRRNRTAWRRLNNPDGQPDQAAKLAATKSQFTNLSRKVLM